ncbi:MAG: hypothetical protein LBJ88_07175 [Campylobacteraceae bacterium]|jgi:hypothetical protein|nr:hypothetical protein [Campylobacteraceae bacterium]
MQIRIQKLGKLFFLALVFSFLVGCGSSDDGDSSGTGFETQSGNISGGNNTTKPIQVPTLLLDLESGVSGFPVAPSHIFGPIWELASVVTHSVEYSNIGYADKLAYQDQVKDEFPDLLQLGHSGVYHKPGYYRGNLIGDASVRITDNGLGDNSIEQAVDLILPLPLFPIDAGVFTSGAIFPEIDIKDALATKVSTTIHYGYFGSPNFQTYKTVLAAAGFAPANGKSGDNVWVKEANDLVYTFEHDNPLLDATIIPIIGNLKIPFIGGTIGGFVNHYITNWTNIDKYASWTISVK